MADPLVRQAPKAGSGTVAPDLTALVSVAEESNGQVRLMNGIDRAPMVLRSVRENAFVLVGALFLPRGCAVEVDFRSDAGFATDGDEPLHVLNAPGVVQKVTMVDSQSAYVLLVHVTGDGARCLRLLRSALEG